MFVPEGKCRANGQPRLQTYTHEQTLPPAAKATRANLKTETNKQETTYMESVYRGEKNKFYLQDYVSFMFIPTTSHKPTKMATDARL